MSSEISPEQLVRDLDSGAALQVLDVRAPERLAAGSVDIVAEGDFLNLRGSRVLTLEDPSSIGLDPRRPVVVVCGHGNDSGKIASFLAGHGFEARSLAGGIDRWMKTLVERPLTPPAGFDRLIQFDRIGKGALGYLLVRASEALAIDPPRRLELFLRAAEQAGAEIVGVADTHVHADYVSGGPALARRLRVPYLLHPADSIYPYDGTPGRLDFEPLEEGLAVYLDDAPVTVMHTPGHTEGSVTLVAGDAAFSGDFVFIQSVGRPDLAGKTAEWTAELWSSVERARKTLAADTIVYPAHYASEREREPDRTVGRAFGRIVADNEPLRLADEQAFRSWVENRAGSFPEAYRRIKAINVGLLEVDDREADELEGGRNECALG